MPRMTPLALALSSLLIAGPVLAQQASAPASKDARTLDTLIVTGDHSTPCKMKGHSWHPVPTMIVSNNCRYDGSTAFGETQCRLGGLGRFEAKHLMLLALAHAGRLEKYGA